MAQKFRIEGLKELDKALGQLPRATGKNVLRRVARKALEPIIEVAKALVLVGLTADAIGLGEGSGTGWKQIALIVAGGIVVGAGFVVGGKSEAAGDEGGTDEK